MKKFNHNYKKFKKIPLDHQEHVEFASDLRKAQEILEPWMNRLYIAYSVKGKECNELFKVLNLLSSKICNTQDDAWNKLKEINGHKTPYYGSGKCAWT